MRVILREEVPNLGDIGDVVAVKAGYARNYLLPRGLAVIADDRQMNRVEHEKRNIEARLAKEKSGADQQKKKLDQVVLDIEKAAGENQKLFGSVTSMEIEALLAEKGYEIERRRIMLAENIKQVGTYRVDVKLHRDVFATITVNVRARQDESAAQAPTEGAAGA